MAKFKQNNLELRDNQKLIFDSAKNKYMSYDTSELFVNSTVSGVTPTEDYHLTTKFYVDDAITTATGSLTTDHGSLTGLSDDDHTQYLLAAGTRELSGDWDAGAYSITTSSGYHWNNVEVHAAGYANITGILDGFELTINAVDDSLIDIAPGHMIHVNMSDRDNPHTMIHYYPGGTEDPTLSGVRSKWIGATWNGSEVAISFDTSFTQAEKRSNAIIGRCWGAGEAQITGKGEYKVGGFSFGKSMEDIAYAFGTVNISGNVLSESGSTMKLDKSAGETFRFSANWAINNLSPNIVVTTSESPIQNYSYHLQGTTTVITETQIDPDNYDNSGVKTSVPTGKWTVQRVYHFPNSNTHVLYGQSLYDTKGLAYDGISTEDPVTNDDILSGSFLAGYLLLKQGCTDLTDTDQAELVQPYGGQAGLVPGRSNHGQLSGLADDDHPQYHNDTRGDALYYRKAYIEQSENILYGNDLFLPSHNNVSDVLDEISHNVLWDGVTARTQPHVPLTYGAFNSVSVASGIGHVFDLDNEFAYHVTWSGASINTSTMYSGTNWIYVDENGTISLSQSEPNYTENIVLGMVYTAGTANAIGTIYNSGSCGDGFGTRVSEAFRHLGPFIYNNGGIVSIDSGDNRKILVSSAGIQNALLVDTVPAFSSADTGHNFGDFKAWFNNSGGWNIDMDFAYREEGRIPNRYNDTTESGSTDTGEPGTTSSGSYTITSTTDLSSSINPYDFVFVGYTDYTAATLVSGVEWTGSQTNINLFYPYQGTNTSGTIWSIGGLNPIDSGKYVKHLLLVTTDGQGHLVYGTEQFADEDSAKQGALPDIPDAIVSNSVQLSYIIVTSGTTSLEGNIYDNRPIPFYTEAGGTGGGSAASDHGNLIGLTDDDHTQYSLSNGTRDYTGIVSYNAAKTFTQDAQIVDKKYVDDYFPIDHGSLTGLSDDDHPQYLTEAEADARYVVSANHNPQFGNYYGSWVSAAESSTSSTTYINKLSATSDTLPPGTYRIGWYYEWDVSSETVRFFSQIQIDDTTTVGELAATSSSAATSFQATSGFYYHTAVASGTAQIDIDYRCEVSNKTAYIRNARLEIWRVE